jgi:hypothetical protein
MQHPLHASCFQWCTTHYSSASDRHKSPQTDAVLLQEQAVAMPAAGAAERRPCMQLYISQQAAYLGCPVVVQPVQQQQLCI